jgi:hypothetical protein
VAVVRIVLSSVKCRLPESRRSAPMRKCQSRVGNRQVALFSCAYHCDGTTEALRSCAWNAVDDDTPRTLSRKLVHTFSQAIMFCSEVAKRSGVPGEVEAFTRERLPAIPDSCRCCTSSIDLLHVQAYPCVPESL